jgi:hypothetical protein
MAILTLDNGLHIYTMDNFKFVAVFDPLNEKINSIEYLKKSKKIGVVLKNGEIHVAELEIVTLLTLQKNFELINVCIRDESSKIK